MVRVTQAGSATRVAHDHARTARWASTLNTPGHLLAVHARWAGSAARVAHHCVRCALPASSLTSPAHLCAEHARRAAPVKWAHPRARAALSVISQTLPVHQTAVRVQLVQSQTWSMPLPAVAVTKESLVGVRDHPRARAAPQGSTQTSPGHLSAVRVMQAVLAARSAQHCARAVR